MIYVDLILNLSLLVALSVISGFIEERYPRHHRAGVLLQGTLFGAAAVIGMLAPLVIGPGLIFDGRSVMVSLCALFYGPWAGAIAALMAIICRFSIGGMGIVMGILVILSSAGIGSIAHFRLTIHLKSPSVKQLYLFGLAVHIAMLLMMLALPQEQVWSAFKRVGGPILLLYPLATVLAGKILSDQVATLRYLAEVQAARQQLDITLKSIGDAVISTDLDGKVLIMNPVAEALTGWTLAEAEGRHLAEVFHIVNAHSRQRVENPVDKVLAKGKIVGLANHTVLIARDGREFQIADSAAPVSDTGGRINGVVMVFRDVTEEYHSIEALRESEALFRKIFEDHAAVKLLIDPETGGIIDANQAAADRYGWSRDQLKRMQIGQINTAPPEVLAENMLRVANQQQFHFEFQHRTADGTLRDVEVFSSRISVKGKTLLHSIVHDITRRKRAEQALIESEDRYRNLIMHSPEAIYVNVEDRVILANNACLALFGANAESDLIGKSPYELFHADCHALVRERIRQIRQEGKATLPIEEKIVRLDGREVAVEVSAAPFAYGGQQAMHVMLRDITSRKQKEAERQMLMAAMEQTGEIVIITDIDGTILYVNPAFERITGYGKEEVLGVNPRILKSGEQDAAYYRQMWRTITAGEVWKGRFVNQRKDGTHYTEEATISPVRDGSGRIVNFAAVKRDISEEIQMEKRLAQAQKMEAVGALASGIAHDFNNLLFPIFGNAEMLMEDLPPNSLAHENAAQIFNAAARAGDLVRQILSFSRQGERKKVPVRVQRVLHEVIKLARSTIPSNIQIEQQIKSDCGAVLMDATQLHQVAMNLVTNAYHAVEQTGGSLSIGLREVDLKCGDRHGTSIGSGRYARMTFGDTGRGIDPGIMDKIFEPYFTTKPQGKGTGLGLSVVYGIVKDAGGDIVVNSQVGKGTTFDVYLPLMGRDTAGDEADASNSDEPRGTERVLIVDDEAAIANLEKQILTRLGYQVEACTSSVDALRLFRQDPDAFDLVITDMAMPNMTGEGLSRELLAVRSDLSIIICTGFSERIGAPEATALGIRGFLMKPVGKGDLARMVRKVLDEGKAAKPMSGL